MARPPLGLLETLRPWHGAGLLHVLLPEGQGAASGDAPGGDAAGSAAQAGRRGGDAPDAGTPDADAPDMRAFPAACEAPRSMQGDPSFDPDAYGIPPDPSDSMDSPYAHGGVSTGTRRGSYSDGGAGMSRAAGPAQGYRQPPPRNAQSVNPAHPSSQAAQPAPGAGLAETLPPVGSGPAASTLPPEQWPGPWRALLGKTPQPAPVLWTYWALGLDLSGCADAARRDTLRRILGALQQPKGSNAFWPVAMPESGAEATPSPAADGSTASATEPVCDSGLFLAGVERIAPRLVVVMGSKALRAFAPDLRARPYQQIPWRGRLLIVLPDMDNLIAAPATVEAVIAYLRTALKPATR
ncbi:hypothetical protein [Nitratidesulfovibrio termitidis]|uniref:hypothetical protein n=1 Tax=Nitratidesulfovibrio termitidis TaxID=42252 RepID=UPI00041E7911|nr:hypothetical protein [Nitratidesulfovibrio termitidis]